MPAKYRIFFPTLSILTAGGATLPLAFNTNSYSASGGSTYSISSIDSPAVADATVNNHSLDFTSNNSPSAAIAVSETSSTPETALNLDTESAEFAWEREDDILGSDAFEISTLQDEIDKVAQVREISEQQIKEFQAAIKYVKKSKQGFRVITDKVKEYQDTPVAQGVESAIRTFQESGAQSLTKKHRDSLLRFFIMYSRLDKFKSINLSKLDDLMNAEHDLASTFPEVPVISYKKVVTNLNKIHWKRKDLRLFKGETDENNWGWGKWKNNPYSIFYSTEEVWKSKINRFVDAQALFNMNKNEEATCSVDAENSVRNQALQEWCKGDKERFKQLVESYKSEIELDIASWLLNQMKMIHNARLARK
ncbi:hypothetical protein [Candidatus Mycoplasma haematominutum]|uniref:Uncharacterized protein n=1 Tax=Candidatus Mycoplasma haematominutum 'Birmingham 1' TaxID=1116213 RepID=G8C3E7_9MOLU|nr:hypothetical protein [Candidatus Mycoplasma haematominutum]CCE66845.1 hypothetical protein MHM_03270 [Candidatus Mycoplasma haematominutum 'Birmingham 1']